MQNVPQENTSQCLKMFLMQRIGLSLIHILSSVVSQKADETALSAAEGRISALESGKADKTELAAQIRALSQSHEADTAALRSENCRCV